MAPIQSEASPLLFCDGAKPILWSKDDTSGTVEQVKEHNSVGVDQCDWGKH